MLLLRGALLVYVCFVGLAMLFENALIYHPVPFPRGAGALGLGIAERRLTTADGVSLDSWYLPAAKPTPAVALFLHGNGGNLTDRRELLRKLTAAPASVFAVDYRGYGRSSGKPSEAGLYRDADAAWQYLTATRHVPPAHIVVFGESLGGAVAIDLARRVHPAGLIVQSSFTSMPDMAGYVLPFVPCVCVRSQFRSLDKIGQIHCPKLFIHSHDDRTVPYAMGRRLYEAAPEPKQFYEIRGATHDDTEAVGGHAYVTALRHFIVSCVPPQEAP